MNRMRRYRVEDGIDIVAWQKARGYVVDLQALPDQAGVIVPGVAAGFVYLTATNVAYLDCFVTNPAASLRDRAKAIAQIARALINSATEAGVRHIVAHCESHGIARLAAKMGLSPIGACQLMKLEITCPS